MSKKKSGMQIYTKQDKAILYCGYALLAVFLIAIIVPMVYIVIASFMDPVTLQNKGISFDFSKWSLDAYERVISDKQIWVGFKNAVLYSVIFTVISVAVTMLAAYPMSLPDFKGKKFFNTLFVITMFFNGGLIPTYLLINNIGLLDSMWAVILPGAFSVWNMIIARTYYQGIPRELREAADVDGASEMRYFFNILLPVCMPVVAVLALWQFVAMWNSYFDAMIYLNSASKQPLQLVLRSILIQSQPESGMIADIQSTAERAKMAKALGKDDVAAEYEELYSKIVKKFQDTFFDAEGNMTAQTQTAHIVALYFQLTPEKYIEKTVEGLKKLLAKENGHLVTGFVGTPYFCHALSQNHALKDAYDLLLREDFPSWLYQVKKGATTIWEHWDGLKDDGSMWSADMNSFNHYAYGAIGEWMYRAMAGIEADPEQPGFKHAVLYPRIGGNLKYTEGNYHSIYGNVGVKWEVQGTQILLTVQIPVNTTAQIRLDQAKAVVKSDGLTFTKAADYMSAEAGSGTYHIVFEQ